MLSKSYLNWQQRHWNASRLSSPHKSRTLYSQSTGQFIIKLLRKGHVCNHMLSKPNLIMQQRRWNSPYPIQLDKSRTQSSGQLLIRNFCVRQCNRMLCKPNLNWLKPYWNAFWLFSSQNPIQLELNDKTWNMKNTEILLKDQNAI